MAKQDGVRAVKRASISPESSIWERVLSWGIGCVVDVGGQLELHLLLTARVLLAPAPPVHLVRMDAVLMLEDAPQP